MNDKIKVISDKNTAFPQQTCTERNTKESFRQKKLVPDKVTKCRKTIEQKKVEKCR